MVWVCHPEALGPILFELGTYTGHSTSFGVYVSYGGPLFWVHEILFSDGRGFVACPFLSLPLRFSNMGGLCGYLCLCVFFCGRFWLLLKGPGPLVVCACVFFCGPSYSVTGAGPTG